MDPYPDPDPKGSKFSDLDLNPPNLMGLGSLMGLKNNLSDLSNLNVPELIAKHFLGKKEQGRILIIKVCFTKYTCHKKFQDLVQFWLMLRYYLVSLYLIYVQVVY